MALDPVPTSSASDGRWKITAVPIGGNALSVAVLGGGTAKAVTYGLTADGFAYSLTQATVEDKRLTLLQDLSRPGKTSETLELKMVASEDATAAANILLPGTAWQLNVRRGVDNATAPTIGQKADVLTVIIGAHRPDAPTENGLDTVSATAYFTAPSVRQGTLVA
jgi:hypothetical protein